MEWKPDMVGKLTQMAASNKTTTGGGGIVRRRLGPAVLAKARTPFKKSVIYLGHAVLYFCRNAVVTAQLFGGGERVMAMSKHA